MNIVRAVFGAKRQTTTEPLYQWDFGQILQFEGIELPANFEAHFATSNTGTAITVIGQDQQAEIPDSLLRTGQYITCWVYLHESELDGETEYVATIPVIKRAKRGGSDPSPTEKDAIAAAIDALNEAEGDAEAWAVGERDGQPVPSTDPAFNNNSKFYAERAEQAVAESGYMWFYIGTDGHLYFEKTPNVPYDFYIGADGHLYAEVLTNG